MVAKRRVQRGEADARRFVSMQTARDLLHGTGDTPAFIDIVRLLSLATCNPLCLLPVSAWFLNVNSACIVSLHRRLQYGQFCPVHCFCQLLAVFFCAWPACPPMRRDLEGCTSLLR